MYKVFWLFNRWLLLLRLSRSEMRRYFSYKIWTADNFYLNVLNYIYLNILVYYKYFNTLTYTTRYKICIYKFCINYFSYDAKFIENVEIFYNLSGRFLCHYIIIQVYLKLFL